MEAATVNVAESADLMTNPKENLEETLQGVERILERSLTSCQLSTSAWSATTAPRFRDAIDSFLILRRRVSAVSKDGPRASWFETRENALLTMRNNQDRTRTC
jgi:hypothetical protein